MRVIVFFIFWFCLLFFLMSKPSSFLWEQIPLMGYFQFPWRLLSLVILVSSFLSGAVFSIWHSKILAICFVLLSVLLSIAYTKPAFYHQRDDDYYISRSNFIDGTNSPGNLFNTVWFNKNINNRKQKKIEIISGKGVITGKQIKSTRYRFSILSDNDVVVRVNTAYFPGWKVVVNGVWKDVAKDNDGLIIINVPRGEYAVLIMLTNTKLQNISIIISFISLLIILFSIFRHGIIKK